MVSGLHAPVVATTISGEIALAGLGGGAVRARTVSGAIALDRHASGGRDIGLSSISGDVTVRLPEATT
jgi:DUF4097 and DUF4098 domain-containing protein YvlB